jgi:hypothetical protein
LPVSAWILDGHALIREPSESASHLIGIEIAACGDPDDVVPRQGAKPFGILDEYRDRPRDQLLTHGHASASSRLSVRE